MAEATDRPQIESADTPPPAGRNKANPPPGRRPWGVLALLISLLLLAAVLGGGYYFWQQLQALRQQQAELVPAQTLESRARAMAQADAELADKLQALAQDANSTDQTVSELRQSLGELREAQQGLAERIDVQVQARRGEWIRAEAAYLANIAIYRVRFYHDVDGALAALRLADQLLARLDSAAIKSRQAVNQAISRLVAVNAPDIDALAGQLESLISKVDILPLDLQIRQADAEDAAAAQAPPAEGWRGRLERAWDRFKATLGELVIVQRERAVEPLIAPEERYFLYHNLRLRLEAARLALIDRNQAVYRRSLERAAEWIQRYYAQGEPPVEEALTSIRRLAQVEIDPEMPELAPLLQPVTQE